MFKFFTENSLILQNQSDFKPGDFSTNQFLNPPLNFNNNSVKQVQSQKHLDLYVDGKLDFHEHLQNIFKRLNKAISLLRTLQNNIPRAPLVTIYKSFIKYTFRLRRHFM